MPAERWAPARKALAPPGAATIRLCRYSGLNNRPPLTLERSRLIIGSRMVAQLVSEFDALPPPPNVISFGCGPDEGVKIIALLAYPRGADVTITVAMQGCRYASNGSVIRGADEAPAGPKLIARLADLAAVAHRT